MSEKRAATGGGLASKSAENRAVGEPIARLADHLGRLLIHADQLLAEWKSHAETMRTRFAAQGEAAGEVLARTLEAALADAAQQATVQLSRAYGANAEKLRVDLEKARQAAADLEAHMKRIAGGAKPTSVDELRAGLAKISAQLERASGRGAAPLVAVGVALVAAALSAAVLVVLLQRPAIPSTPTEAPAAVSVAPIAAAVPDAAVAPTVAPPSPSPPGPCTALTVEAPVTAGKLALACQTELCGPPRPKLLAECKRDDPAGADLVAALRAVEHDRPLARLGCKPDPKPAVTVRWLLDCSSTR